MPEFNWDALAEQVGPAAGRRLRPFILLHYYLARARRYTATAVILGSVYMFLTQISDMATAKPGEFHTRDDWPLLGRLALLCLLAVWLLEGAAARLLRVWLPRLRARWAALHPPPPETAPAEAAPTPQDLAAQLEAGVAQLNERWQGTRDRLGAREWQRLARLRNQWLWLSRVRTLSLVVTIYYAALVALEVLTKGQPLAAALAWNPFQLAPFVALASAAGVWITTHVIRQRFASLGWLGFNPELLQQALWTEYAARVWQADGTAYLQELEASRRLAQERQAAPPWWKVEFSGGHLVWWLSFLIILAALLRAPVPEIVGVPALGVLFFGGLIKLFFWVAYGLTTNAARLGRLRFYRWWSRGWLPVLLALLPAALLLVGEIQELSDTDAPPHRARRVTGQAGQTSDPARIQRAHALSRGARRPR